MKKLKYYVICFLFLFTFSSCYNYKMFGIVGNGKRNYYTKWADNAPKTNFNYHKKYNKKNVNQNYGKKKYKKYKGIDRGCPF